MNVLSENQIETIRQAIEQLREQINRFCQEFEFGHWDLIKTWNRLIEGKLLPRLSPDFPLMVAICGGGSAGKSTLFNTLSGERVSPSGGVAGINRRVLVSGSGDLFRQEAFLTALFESLAPGCEFGPLENIDDLTRPGCPLYVINKHAPRNMVLMDTPDFDTGWGGAYTNRDVVRQALELADILIYIFTNANYNNRDNTEFISSVLTTIGTRKSVLVYRIDAGAPNSQVLNHAMTVAHHIYGSRAEQHVLGIYRADEDNAVAAGEKLMNLEPVRVVDLPFPEMLRTLDPRSLRPDLLYSIVTDVVASADQFITEASYASEMVRLYKDAVEILESHCARQALAHFPMDQVLKRFLQIWMDTDPTHVRVMRKTGEIVGYPVKALSSAIRWMGGKIATARSGSDNGFDAQITEDLVAAVNHLRKDLTGEVLTVSLSANDPAAMEIDQAVSRIVDLGKPTPIKKQLDKLELSIPVPPIIEPLRQQFIDGDWQVATDAVLHQRDAILHTTTDIEAELNQLALTFREKMDFSAKLFQTLSAVLNVVPATVAVTYILATGDPVGGAGIKIKLAGLFGLNDLYALVAIPATTGLSRADRKQLEVLLAPVAETWLNNKLTAIRDLFRQEITGDLVKLAENSLQHTAARLPEIRTTLETCKEMVSLK